MKRALHFCLSCAIFPSLLDFGGGDVGSAFGLLFVSGLVVVVGVLPSVLVGVEGFGWGAVVVVVSCSSARPVFSAERRAAVIVVCVVVLVVVSLGVCVVVGVALVVVVVVVGGCRWAVVVVSRADGRLALVLGPSSKYCAVVAPWWYS